MDAYGAAPAKIVSSSGKVNHPESVPASSKHGMGDPRFAFGQRGSRAGDGS